MSSNALAVVEGNGHALAPHTARLQLLRPIAAPQEVIKAQEETRALVTEALTEGRDYGKVPGVDKPFLFKAGAERIALGFGCYFGEPEIVAHEIDHDREVRWSKMKWKAGQRGVKEKVEGVSYGLYRYVVRVPLILRETNTVVGYGIGSCSTMESKYVENPRDAENTVLKMGDKRAKVSGVLTTFGLSDQFTQDEDAVEPQRGGDSQPAQSGPVQGGSTAPNASAPNEPRVSNGVIEQDAPCPKCGGKMWDNRATKTNPKAPDYKCRDKANCDGVYWAGQWPPVSEEQKAAEKAAEQLGATEKRKARPFPQTFPVKELRGVKVGEATRPQLLAALTASREKNASAWIDLLSEELEERNLAAQTDLGVSGHVDMPPGGRPGAALGPNEVLPAALADGDDSDLPF